MSIDVIDSIIENAYCRLRLAFLFLIKGNENQGLSSCLTQIIGASAKPKRLRLILLYFY